MSSPRRPGADAPARLADVETLRRLTRDAFAEITSVRDRLRDLERSVATERASREADRARVDTRVEVCTASPARGRRDARRRGSRVRARPPSRRRLTTTTRSSCVSRPRRRTGAARRRITRRRRAASPTSRWTSSRTAAAAATATWVRLVLVGAEGHDAAATLSPTSKGASLSGLGSKGAAALAGCRGAAECASVDARDGVAGVAAGVFSGDPAVAGARPARDGAATVRPGARAAASLAVAVTDAFAGGVSSARAPRRAACLSAQMPGGGWGWRARRGVGLGGRLRGRRGAVGARPRLGRRGDCAPSETSPGWGLALGRGRGDGVFAGADGDGDGDGAASGVFAAPLRGEAFLRLGGGFANVETIIPGIVFTRDETARSWDAAFACKVLFDVAS